MHICVCGMQRRDNLEAEIQRQARVRDEQHSLLLRRLLLQELSSTLGGADSAAVGGGEGGAAGDDAAGDVAEQRAQAR